MEQALIAAPPEQETTRPFELEWTFRYRADLQEPLSNESVNQLFGDVMRALAAKAQVDLPGAFAVALRQSGKISNG